MTPPPPNPATQTLAATVLGLQPQLPGTTVVAVDGPSGSGKSTFAQHLSSTVSGDGVAVEIVQMDEFLQGWDGLDEVTANLVRWVLEPLRAGRPARYHRYDWIAGRFADWQQVPPAQVLIVEGVGSGAVLAAPMLDLLFWIEAPLPVRFERGIARDGEAYRPNWERWAVQESRLFERERTRERADVILDGTRPID